VANALASTSRNTIATRFWESRPVRSTMALSRLRSGRTRTSIATTYARTRTRVRAAPARSAVPTTATTKASRHQAVTSSTAEHAEMGEHRGGKEPRGHARRRPPEQRGAEQDAADHLAHHLRLADGAERDAQQARHDEDDEDVDGDDTQQALGGHQPPGRRAARARRGAPD